MARDNLVITIERQYGSGGRIVGKRLAEDLGIHFYDEEILKMTSEISAIGEQYFKLKDEKAGNNLLYKIVGGLKDSLSEPSLDDSATSPDNLFRFQSSVIRRLAAEESCVIMGRCADYVLESEGLEGLIKIFIHSDIPSRIRRVMEVDGADTKEALKRIDKINKERTMYHKYYTKRDWEDFSNYDMTVNTTKIDLDQTVQLIKEYLKIRGF